MALINSETKKLVSYAEMLEDRITNLQRIRYGAMASRQFAAAVAADKQLAGALIALRRETRRMQREGI